MNLYNSSRNGSVDRVGGVKVSIVAFQAIDPGSIPGWRIILGSKKLLFDDQPSQKV